jgi:endonuclease/exonuclease/phosphatase family metal-dependent hydrolase
MAAVLRGALTESLQVEQLRKIDVPVLVLNGKADAANQKVETLLREIPTARAAMCEGDHNSTPYQPTYHQAVIEFLEEQWRRRRVHTDGV